MFEMILQAWPWWLGFHLLVIGILALDLGVLHKGETAIDVKGALKLSALWIAVALAFNVLIFFFWGQINPASELSSSEAFLDFLTAYLVEKSLAIDNLFVMSMIFGSLAIPQIYQHRVLFWGILGAIVMRAVLIFAGIALIQHFHWLLYVFGAFLIFMGIKMLKSSDEDEQDLNSSKVFLWLKSHLRLSPTLVGNHFWVKKAGLIYFTPLFLALVMIEVTDLVFAVDSIPAVLAVTTDPFIVYTSNIFAILGLRSLYFALADMIKKFKGLELSLALILVFVGCKMLLLDLYKIPAWIALLVVVGLLVWGVLRSRKSFAEKES